MYANTVITIKTVDKMGPQYSIFNDLFPLDYQLFYMLRKVNIDCNKCIQLKLIVTLKFALTLKVK